MKIPKAFFPLYLFPFVRYCHHIITGPVWLVLSHFFRFEGVIKYTKSTFWGNKNISRLQSQTACLRKKLWAKMFETQVDSICSVLFRFFLWELFIELSKWKSYLQIFKRPSGLFFFAEFGKEKRFTIDFAEIRLSKRTGR